MKTAKKRFIQAGMVLVVVGTFVVYAVFELNLFTEKETSHKASIPVRTVQPSLGNVEQKFKLTGYIRTDYAGSSEYKIALSIPEQYMSLFQEDILYEEGSLYAEIPNRNINEQNQEIEKLPLALTSVAPFISPDTKTFAVDCTLEQTEEVYPGMFARVFITIEQQTDVYRLPYTTLVAGNTLWYVQDEKAQRIDYTPAFEGDNYFTVPQEFSSYQFIYEGQHFLKQNDIVHVINR